MAGFAIEGYLKPEVKSDHRDRWLDALNWYGQAVSEPLPSAQLVKYVAALERLTVTENSIANEATDVVTRRTALLTVENANEICKAVENARTLYRWRSNLMHGRSSPLTKKVLPIMRLADSTTQKALFGALEFYVGLEMEKKTTSKDLEKFFVELENGFLPNRKTDAAPHSKLLDKAMGELKAAEKNIRSTRAREHIRRALALVNKVIRENQKIKGVCP